MRLGSFADESVQRCPFPFIQKLHQEAPVYIDPVTSFYIVSRYDDIAYVSMHPEIFSNKTTLIVGGDKTAPNYAEIAALYAANGYERPHTLVTNDPPSHTRYRTIVDKVFTPSYVKKLEPYIVSLCDELIDGFENEGTTDLNVNYCMKIPLFVIADQLGLPRDGWLKFKGWSDATIQLNDPTLTPDERLRLVKIHIEMQRYLAQQQGRYRTEPSDSFFSMLANANVEGEYLTPTEFVALGEQFLVAGNETTTAAIGHAVAMLVRDAELTAAVRADSTRISSFVEEVLRIHAPSPHLYRQVLQDVTLSGTHIPKGSIIMLSYLAGNHDPAKYPQPDKVDLARPGIKNHLAFGRGIHYCIGNLLARAEMRIAITRLLERFDEIRFNPSFPEPQIAANFHAHQLENLHVSFTKRNARGV